MYVYIVHPYNIFLYFCDNSLVKQWHYENRLKYNQFKILLVYTIESAILEV